MWKRNIITQILRTRKLRIGSATLAPARKISSVKEPGDPTVKNTAPGDPKPPTYVDPIFSAPTDPEVPTPSDPNPPAPIDPQHIAPVDPIIPAPGDPIEEANEDLILIHKAFADPSINDDANPMFQLSEDHIYKAFEDPNNKTETTNVGSLTENVRSVIKKSMKQIREIFHSSLSEKIHYIHNRSTNRVGDNHQNKVSADSTYKYDSLGQSGSVSQSNEDLIPIYNTFVDPTVKDDANPMYQLSKDHMYHASEDSNCKPGILSEKGPLGPSYEPHKEYSTKTTSIAEKVRSVTDGWNIVGAGTVGFIVGLVLFDLGTHRYDRKNGDGRENVPKFNEDEIFWFWSLPDE